MELVHQSCHSGHYVFIDECGSTSGLPEITGGRGRVCVHIDKCATSEDGT